jgi:hypothetical protein
MIIEIAIIWVVVPCGLVSDVTAQKTAVLTFNAVRISDHVSGC